MAKPKKKRVVIGHVRQEDKGLGVRRPRISTIADTKAIEDPPAGYVAFNCKELELYFACPLNTEGGQPVSGGPQYDISPRVLRTGVAEYTGHEPMRQSIHIFLDHYTGFANDSVLPIISYFDQLCAFSEDLRRPPQFQIRGDVPYRFHKNWVMDGYPDWDSDPDPIRRQDGELIRQALTVNILEKVPDKLLSWSVDKERKKGKGKQKKIHIVANGEDNLSDVSKAEFGNRNHGPELSRLNNIPLYKKLKVGQRIRLY